MSQNQFNLYLLQALKESRGIIIFIHKGVFLSRSCHGKAVITLGTQTNVFATTA